MTTDLSTLKPFQAEFGRLMEDRRLPGAPWLDALRRSGLDRFGVLGFPTPKNEAWKYTNLRGLAELSPVASGQAHALSVNRADLPEPLLDRQARAARLVFVNGWFRPDLSDTHELPAGARLSDLRTALTERPELLEGRLGQTAVVDGHALIALNTAFFGDGAVLTLAEGARVEQPIELAFIAAPEAEGVMWHPRLLVVAEADSEATLVEVHQTDLAADGAGQVAYFSNPVTELVLGTGAHVRHYKAQIEGPHAYHIATATATLGDGATYDSFVLNSGGLLARCETRTVLQGEGVTSKVNGVYMLRGRQVCDNTTLVDHAQPNGSSRQVFKGAIDGAARGVFQGCIRVRPDAQKTDGYQLNNALLLSDQAEIDSKPQLEIFADDVKCSHGATAGEIDDEALFYLRSRGIPTAEARALLIASFLQDALDEIGREDVRAVFATILNRWLEDS